MANRLIKRGRATYVEAVPSRPAVPAYCVSTAPAPSTEQKKGGLRTGFSDGSRPAYSSGGSISQASLSGLKDNKNELYYGMLLRPTGEDQLESGVVGYEIASGIRVLGPAGAQRLAADASVTAHYEGGVVCYPAIPAIEGSPAQVINESQLGWNGGARSIDFFAGDGFVQFRLGPRPIGVVAGLVNTDASAAFNEATHAIYAHGVTIDILERGQVVATAPASPADNPLITIVRRDHRVYYYVDSWLFTSTTQSTGPVYLDAALYSTGDMVDEPVIGALTALPAGLVEHGSGAGTLPALAGLGSKGGYAVGLGELPALTGAGTGFQTGLNRGAGTLPALAGQGADRAYAAGAGEIPVLAGQGEGGFPQFSTAYGGGVMPPLIGGGVMMTGTLGHGAAVLPALSGYGADRPYAAGAGTLPPMLGYGDDGPSPGTYGVMEWLYLLDFVVLQPVVFMVMYDGLTFEDSASIVLVYDHTAFDGLMLSDSATTSMIIEAMVRDGLALSDRIDTERQALQYAVNIATGALTSYTNFDFLGFAQTARGTYGYRADGLYRIGGSTDDGALMEALLDLGAIDPGTNLKQRMEGAHLGLATDGSAYMRLVGDDGQEWLYQIDQRPAAARAKFGKGLESREWNVSLHLVDASTADLQSIEFLVHTAVKRWKR